MHQKVFVIDNLSCVKAAVDFLLALRLDQLPKLEVIVRRHKKDRSLAQNNLMWMWHTVYAKEIGTTKDAEHSRFKLHYVLPILLRDEETGRLQGLVNHARRLGSVMVIVDLISTTCLDTAQMAEALTEYDMDSAEQGIVFPHPADLYYMALDKRMSH